MVRPLDLSKFISKYSGKIEGISVGFHDPKTWISTGNFTLNYLISERFDRGVPLSQITMLAGGYGSGKSLIAANVMREALEQDICVIAFDSENGLTKEWLKNAGIDVDKYEKSGLFMRVQVALVDDLAKTLSAVMIEYKEAYKDTDPDERPKLLFVVDSLGMLVSRTDLAQFEKGDLKGDFGRKAKALNHLVRNCVVQFSEWEIGMLATNHTYASQDMFDPDDKISGGSGFLFASSIVVAMKKLKLKEDEHGNAITTVTGIRSSIKVVKSRHSKPFEAVQVKIPYTTGIDPYSGLVELFEKQGVFEKVGNRLKYDDLEGNEHKYFRKHFMTDEGKELLDLMMAEHSIRRGAQNDPEIDDLIDSVGDTEEIADGSDE